MQHGLVVSREGEVAVYLLRSEDLENILGRNRVGSEYFSGTVKGV